MAVNGRSSVGSRCQTAMCAQGLCNLNTVIESIVITITSDFFHLAACLPQRLTLHLKDKSN